MSLYCFGIDVGGTTIKCGLFQVDGTLLEKWEIKTRLEGDGEKILPDVAETIAQKISERNIAKEDIAGVGIGIPGPINEAGEAAVAVNRTGASNRLRKS
jgi:glucokinase